MGSDMYHSPNGYPGSLSQNSAIKDDRPRGKKTAAVNRRPADMGVGADEDVVADGTCMPPGASNYSVLHNDAALTDADRSAFRSDNGTGPDDGMGTNLDIPGNDGTRG